VNWDGWPQPHWTARRWWSFFEPVVFAAGAGRAGASFAVAEARLLSAEPGLGDRP